jgi:uncharacterized membrane protein
VPAAAAGHGGAWRTRLDESEAGGMTGVVWGLLGATFIGVSDCVARVTAQRVSMALLLAAVMGTSTLAVGGWIIASDDWPQWHAYGWAASAVSGFLNLLALFLLYSALVRGPVSVASPAASSFSVILVILNALAGGALRLGAGRRDRTGIRRRRHAGATR